MACKILLFGALLVASSSALTLSKVNHQKPAALVMVDSKVGKDKFKNWWAAWRGGNDENGLSPMITKDVWKEMTPSWGIKGRGKGTTGSVITEIDPLLDSFHSADTAENRLDFLKPIKKKNDDATTISKSRQGAFDKLETIVERRIKEEEQLIKRGEAKAAAKGKEILLIGDVKDMTIKLQYESEIKAMTKGIGGGKTFGKYPSSVVGYFPLGKEGWDTYVEGTEVTHISAHGGLYNKDAEDDDDKTALTNKLADEWENNEDISFVTAIWLAADTPEAEDDWMITPDVVETLTHVPSKLLFINTCLAGFTKELACAFIAKGTEYVIAYARVIQGRSAASKAGSFYAEWRKNDWSDEGLVTAFDTKLWKKRSGANSMGKAVRLFTSADNEVKSTKGDETWEC